VASIQIRFEGFLQHGIIPNIISEEEWMESESTMCLYPALHNTRLETVDMDMKVFRRIQRKPNTVVMVLALRRGTPATAPATATSKLTTKEQVYTVFTQDIGGIKFDDQYNMMTHEAIRARFANNTPTKHDPERRMKPKSEVTPTTPLTKTTATTATTAATAITKPPLPHAPALAPAKRSIVVLYRIFRDIQTYHSELLIPLKEALDRYYPEYQWVLTRYPPGLVDAVLMLSMGRREENTATWISKIGTEQKKHTRRSAHLVCVNAFWCWTS
jgi:hypothetical protein